MKNTLEFLKGKKTYGVAIVGGLYLLGCFVGWFEWDEKVAFALGVGGVATLRSALKGVLPTVTDKAPLVLIACSLLFLTGCTGMGKLAKALAKDEAIVVVKVNTIYGTGALTRIGGHNSGVAVAPDGTVSIAPATNGFRIVTQTNFFPVFLQVTNFVDRVVTNTAPSVTSTN